MTDFVAWMLSLGAFAAVCVCTAIAATSVAGDPPRGRRRCPRCWHELGPADRENARRCSECGYEAASEAETLRTRRRLGRAVIAVLGVVAVVGAARVRLMDRGGWAMAPSSVLLLALPYIDDSGFRSPAWELAQRVGDGTTSVEQDEAAVAAIVEGDDNAPPTSVSWRLKYRDLIGALRARHGRDPERLRGLLDIPPLVEISAIPAARAPRVLVVDVEVWWPSTVEARCEVAFGDGTVRQARFAPEARHPPLFVEVPDAIAPGESFEVRLFHRPAGMVADAGDGWTAAAPFVSSIPKVLDRVVEPPAPVWEPADGEAMRATVARIFDEGLIVWREGVPRAGLRFDRSATFGPEFEGTAVGLRIELLEHGEVRRTSRMWWRGGRTRTEPRWIPSIEDREALARLYADENAQGWSMRIVGDERLASYALRADEIAGVVTTGAAEATDG
ncbi:MAG: hypothetical protein ACKO0W_03350, partial [Planctomycetota bacterium]